MTVFQAYASYYDLFYATKDYAAEAEYVVRYLRKVRPKARGILELGCGTGAHAAELVGLGYDVTGVDLSKPMLDGANRRREALSVDQQPRMELIQGDVRSVRAGRDFDAVVSLFHVMSYQTSNADLLAACSTAAAHLPPGGIFLFDFWYGPAVLSLGPETRVQELENSDVRVSRIARPRLKENSNVVEVNFTILVEDKGTGSLRRFEEMHEMRYLFLPEIDWMLEKLNMQREIATKWMSDCEPSTNSWSAFVVARKLEDMP